MNNISFTGLANIKMGQSKQWSKCFGLYPSITGEIKRGEKFYRDYKLHVDLINDEKTKDFDNLLSAMADASVDFATSYFRGKPNRVEIFLRSFHVNDDVSKIYYFQFRINGVDATLCSRKGLKLYTWLADITRRIGKMPEMTQRQRDFANFLNKRIHHDAMLFIDNM